MKTEDDTFRILSRCTYEELRERMLASEYGVYMTKEDMEKIVTDNHWTIEEWKIACNRYYGRLTK